MKKNTAVVKMSAWFKEKEKNIEFLLPHKLPDDVFQPMLACAQSLIDSAEAKQAVSEDQHKANIEALELVIAMFLADEKGLFKARRADVEQGVKAYAMNLVLEGLRKKGLVSFKEFTLDDVLTLNFERNIQTTPMLRKFQEELKKRKKIQ